MIKKERKRDAKGRFISNKESSSNGDVADVDINFIRNRLLANIITSRSNFWDQLIDPRRDIESEAGYPKYHELNIDHYKKMYDREPVAARVVEIFPEESWMVNPEIKEISDSKETSAFDEAIETVGKNLVEDEWFKSEKGNPIWNYFKRADTHSGIGSYGIMMIGINDGKKLDEEADLNSEFTGKKELIYIRVFDESQIRISEWDENENSARIGKPIMYTIDFHDESNRKKLEATKSTNSYKVHWTRVIHIADNLGSSESFGKPRQQQVYNRLHDLHKLHGGQAEMYWRGAFPGYSVESHPSLGPDVKLNKKEIIEQISGMQNGLQRWLAIVGASIKSLAPQVVSPVPHIKVAIEAICIKLGVPMRIFMGSERGELSSSQDDDSWNDTLANRQNNYLTPYVISPFIGRLIKMGILPQPQEGYKVEWPDLNALDEETKASIALKRTQALATYLSGDIGTIIDIGEFLIKELGYEKDEVEKIQKNIDKQVADLMKKEDEEEQRMQREEEEFERQQAEEQNQ